MNVYSKFFTVAKNIRPGDLIIGANQPVEHIERQRSGVLHVYHFNAYQKFFVVYAPSDWVWIVRETNRKDNAK